MDLSRETGEPHLPGESSPMAEEGIGAGIRCAYNRTRGYILGVEVDAGDFSYASLADRLPLLTPKSGSGLWMVPFKGIPATEVPVPLDLIYMDEGCRVIEAVEFYPTFRVSPSSPPAASVLALPVHSVFASHTQPGDEVGFGRVEEVVHELALLFGTNAAASAVQESLVVREEPLRGAALAPEHLELRPTPAPVAPPAEKAGESEAGKKTTAKPKSWLQRLLTPEPVEPRKAPRAALPGLAAYFWTGGSPQAHAIRNISATGLYVLTEERWYPGTLVQMTLKKSSNGGAGSDSTISLLAKANRWGNDGVGLSFVVRDPRNSRNKTEAEQASAVDRETLDRFLAHIGHGQG